MRTLTLSLASLAIVATVGCSNPNAPSVVDTSAAWAAAHIHEVCIGLNDGGSRGIYGTGVLIAKDATLPSGAVVVVISYCNPAE